VRRGSAQQRGISFKVDADRFLELTDRPGIIPHRTGKGQMGAGRQPDALDDAEMAALLQRSYAWSFPG
jgi:predicted DNA-binding protein (MmcQ/YjbR family)